MNKQDTIKSWGLAFDLLPSTVQKALLDTRTNFMGRVGGIQHFDKDSETVESEEVWCSGCKKWTDGEMAAFVDGEIFCVTCVKEKYLHD